jgi:hypothetical protein
LRRAARGPADDSPGFLGSRSVQASLIRYNVGLRRPWPRSALYRFFERFRALIDTESPFSGVIRFVRSV